MPIYVFSCPQCKVQKEIRQSFDQTPPTCDRGHEMKRERFPFSFTFAQPNNGGSRVMPGARPVRR
jgi:hypothetical protein